MSKKLFLRILHVCIRIAVCGLGCMMLTAAIAVVAAPDQSLTQAASKSFLQNETPLLKDQPDFSPEEAVLWKKSSYGAAGYSRMIPAHYFPLFPAVAAKANFSPLMQFILQSGASDGGDAVFLHFAPCSFNGFILRLSGAYRASCFGGSVPLPCLTYQNGGGPPFVHPKRRTDDCKRKKAGLSANTRRAHHTHHKRILQRIFFGLRGCS